jgi:hypothetical protein
MFIKNRLLKVTLLTITFFMLGCSDKSASTERFEQACVESFLTADNFKGAPLKDARSFVQQTCHCASKQFALLPEKSRKQINDLFFSESGVLRENDVTKSTVKSIADCMLQSAISE